MKKYFLMMVVAVAALTMGVMTSCGGDDDDPIVEEKKEVEPKHELSEWNEYVKTLTWTSMTQVNNILIIMSGDNAHDNDWTEFCVSYMNNTDADDTETVKNYHVYDLSARTNRDRWPWLKFNSQKREGTVKIENTGNVDAKGQTIYDVTVNVKEMQDTQGTWAENVTVHCVSAISGMLTY